MTKSTLYDLNLHLFAALERLNDEGLSEEELASEVKRANAITGIATGVISNARLQLDIYKASNECRGWGGDRADRLPRMMSDVLTAEEGGENKK